MTKFHADTSVSAAASSLQWLGAAAVTILTAEAARHAEWYWLAAVAAGAVTLAVRILRHSGSRERGLVTALALLGISSLVAAGLTGHTALHASTLQNEAVHDAVVERDELLQSSITAAQRIASQALDRVAKHGSDASPAALEDLLSDSPIEAAVAVIDGDTVLAVAGPHRMQPIARTTPAALVSTPFARMLIIRSSRAHRQAQVILLLDSLPGLPVAAPSLAARAGRWQRVHWSWDPALNRTVEFGSIAAATSGVMAGMRAVAPPVGTFALREAQVARIVVAVGLVMLALLILVTASSPLVRAGAIILPLIALARSDVAGQSFSIVVLRIVTAAAVLFLLAIALWQRPPRRNAVGVVVSFLLLAAGPVFVLLLANRAIPHGVALSLPSGFEWQLLIALGAGGYFALATAPLRSDNDQRAARPWGLLAAAAALIVGLLGVEAWQPVTVHSAMGWSTWASWYLPLWLVPMVLMLPRMPSRMRLLALATTAGVLAAMATWSASLDRRMELARADLDRLTAPSDSAAITALDTFAVTARRAHATHLDRLYATWSASPLAAEGVPTYLALWSADGHQRDAVALDSLSWGWRDLQPLVQSAGNEARRIGLTQRVGHHEVLILPLAPDTIATIAIGPRSRLLVPTVFGLLVGWRAPPSDPPYTVTLPSDSVTNPDSHFHRDQRFIVADATVLDGDVQRVVRATVEMPSPQPFLIRAALVVLLDALAIAGIWLLLQRLLGFQRPLTAGVFRRSYRRTVAATLMAFFIVPATLLTLSSVLRLRSDSQQQHAAEMAGVLSDVSLNGGLAAADLAVPVRDSLGRLRLDSLADSLVSIGENVNAAIGLYRQGRLYAASDSLLAKLGLVPPVFDRTLHVPGDADTNTLRTPLRSSNLRLGLMATPLPGTTLLVAVPGSETALAREDVDQALRLILVALLGIIASVLVAGSIAGRLGQPIDTLRRTAVAIGRREALPPAGNVPSEFVPVFGAINQMERDLLASEAELRSDRARTAAILATVATGVISVDSAGRVTHANPRAAELVGHALTEGELLGSQLTAEWVKVVEGVTRLSGRPADGPESRELPVGERLFATTLAPLTDGGLVLAITDITEASRAARIVAWGEMARQVAHEIKNPLTPMRLGLQHLRRVNADHAPDFPRLVDETAERLLLEIERLDRIARSFARYGAPPEAATPLEPIDLRSVVDELASLFALGAERLEIDVTGTVAGPVRARREELLQVLLNLLDNARQAGASVVRMELEGYTLVVIDNGRGIPPDQLGRIFEPSFSTNTSGTGLGLAIVRRLIEGWEATIGVDSTLGQGATFTIRFLPGQPAR